MSTSPTRQFRDLLAAPGLIVAPGAYDAISARIVAASGFPALYLGSFATAASLLGMPDVGVITQTELVDAARRITAVVDIPVIADGENGFGNAINVRRTVREFERAGVAAIHVEDCDPPKHVGRIPDRVVSRDQLVEKIRAAVDARRDPSFAIIARTDSKPVHGLDEAVERIQACFEAGADLGFIVGLQPDEIPGVTARVTGPIFNVNYFTPAADLEKAGLKVAIYPLTNLLAAVQSASEAMAELRRTGSVEALRDRLDARPAILKLVEMEETERQVREYKLR
jgi:2-methylisocitrate lyase-like PEP mutase family enzyme